MLTFDKKRKSSTKKTEASNLTPDEWALEQEKSAVSMDTNTQQKKEVITTAPVRMPKSLSVRLEKFIGEKALRHQSKNQCLIDGLDMFLSKNGY